MFHIEGLYHMFEYISKHDISRGVFDPFQPKVDDIAFVLGTVY